jgi:aminoglycoside phosphotransferase family enzyme
MSLRSEPSLRAAMRAVVRRLEAFLVRRRSLLRQRVRERRIVDGHGDLRPEHVYTPGVPRIIDCLEFRPDLRQLDPVSELAHLALECRRLGRRSIGPTLLRRYRERTGDRPPPELVHLYGALNAVIRARIAIEHLADPGSRTREELIGRADGYIAIAAAEIRFLSG